MKTRHGNILFDPGMGTLTGLREMGVLLGTETDAIIVSHFHPSARFDLHTILNECGGYCPGRSWTTGGRRPHKLPLFSSRTLIEGRNDHPPVLIPSDREVVQTCVAEPGQAFYLSREDGRCRVEACKHAEEARPRSDALLLRTFPAYHSEAAKRSEDVDEAGMRGEVLCCYFLQTPDYGVLFTGDTEYPAWADDDAVVAQLRGKVTVLIANMKTIEYLPRKEGDPIAGGSERDWTRLRLTFNQLGFEGTRRLADRLRPKALVIRALGLECVVSWDEGAHILRYVPENLGIYRDAMQALLEDSGVAQIVIPGRHEMVVTPGADSEEVEVKDEAVVPAFPPPDHRLVGGRYVTGNRDLTRRIDWALGILRRDPSDPDSRPFIVIQGESGLGKSFLAEGMAAELSGGARINYYDLATVEKESAMYGNILFGWKKGLHFREDEGHPGLLSRENGILILNQLEKLPISETRKFLDLLWDWRYTRKGLEDEYHAVKVRIIFTTNVDIDDATNLTPDLKNRLMDRILEIPPLHTLKPEERTREISLVVNKWSQEEGFTLETNAWRLLHRVDLSNGAYRCLRGLLEKAKSLAVDEVMGQSSERPATQPLMHITEAFLREAMVQNGVGFEGESAPGSTSQGVPASLAWIMSVWISYGCVNKSTYQRMREGQGKTYAGFNRRLAEFRGFFGSSEDAWAFFGENHEAIDALEREGLRGFVEHLEVIPEAVSPGDYFEDGERPVWLRQREEALRAILRGNFTMQERIKRGFCRALERACRKRG